MRTATSAILGALLVLTPVAWPVTRAAEQEPSSFKSHRELEDEQHRDLAPAAFEATSSGSSAGVEAAAVSASSPTRFVMGWAPYWLPGAWQSYRWSTLSQVAYFRSEVNFDGHLVAGGYNEPPTDLISTAHANGVTVALTFIPVGFSQDALNKELLFSPTYYRRAAQEMVDKVVAVGADGINVDFEGVTQGVSGYPDNRAAFVDFVREVTTRMHAAKPGSTVSVDVPAIDWNDAYDDAGLAANADYVVIMAYDYWWPGSGQAGPVAPLYDTAWRSDYSVRHSLDVLLGQVDRSKVVLGVPWYGIKFSTGSTAVPSNGSYVTHPRFNEASDAATQFGRTWYPTSQVPYVAGADPGSFQTWYDDYDSMNAKYSVAANEALHGVAVWALGYDGGRPEPWDALQLFGAPSPDTLTRLEGSDRYRTAIAISRDSFKVDDGAQCAVLATGTNWPDALGGAVLARACNGPLLLSKPDDLSGITADEVARVLPAGGLVHLLGGTSALSAEVENDVRGLGFTTNRIAGKDRVETATTLADSINNGPTAVVLGTKDNFPDVLSLAAPAAEHLYPVLLTASAKLSDATRNFLRGPRAANVKTVYVAGGESAVNSSVTDELTSMGLTVVRLAGNDRYETSAAVAASFAPSPTQVALATGTNFADGLTGAANAAGLKAPLLLVTSGTLPAAPWAYLQQHATSLVGGRVYGGFAAVSRAVQDVAQTLIAP